MNINRPILLIPNTNCKKNIKYGGGHTKYIGDSKYFEEHKKNIISNIDDTIKNIDENKAPISNPENINFFEIELKKQARSKSGQPIDLLSKYHIDLYGRKNQKTFYAAAKKDGLANFKEAVSGLSLEKNKEDSAWLSHIRKIKSVNTIQRDVHIKDDQFNGYIYFHSILSQSSCENITNQLNEKYKTKTKFLVMDSGLKLIYGNISKSVLDEISVPFLDNPFCKIESELYFKTQQISGENIDLSGLEIEDATTMGKVGMFDTGVATGSLMKDYLIGTRGLDDKYNDDHSHGTFVASRIIFGNEIDEQVFKFKKLTTLAKVLDVRVFTKVANNEFSVSEQDLIDIVRQIVDEYSKDIKVYNLSLNWEIPASLYSKKIITRELDALAYKYKVIFVVSSGNNNNHRSQGYPSCLFRPESIIQTPADIINGLSVGSIAHVESSNSVSSINDPSPFTRRGFLGYRKPELVHCGGNVNMYSGFSGVGVKAIVGDPECIAEDVGTSFSTPIVSQIVSRVYEYLRTSGAINESNISDLTKALVIHSANYCLPANTKLKNRHNMFNLVGFGIPNFENAINCSELGTTFIYTSILGEKIIDKKDGKEKQVKIHKILFDIPNDVVGKNKKIKVKGTLVFTPPINSTSDFDYSLVDIGVNLHYKNSKGTLVAGRLTTNEEDYRKKWYPIKHFEQIISPYEAGAWEIWLTLNTRGSVGTDSDYKQPYSLVITIEDFSDDIEQRIDLYPIIKNKFPAYVAIEPQIKIKV